MAKDFLNGISQAGYVDHGYAQVEPNHLSAQRTGQIYAQLPAKADISQLENGQFVKYNYKDGIVDFEGAGEWMLVYNEVKLYHDGQDECEFAMLASNYGAKVYSPSDGVLTENAYSRHYGDIVAPADPYSLNSTIDPFKIYNKNEVKLMDEGTSMVPRVFKTNIGDIFTTNCIATEPAVGNTLTPNATDGILKVVAGTDADNAEMLWQVVKVYTMPDGQPGAKIMRIK